LGLWFGENEECRHGGAGGRRHKQRTHVLILHELKSRG
jgi:hypothetical protein